MSEVLYRYEDVQYAALADEFGESRGVGYLDIQLHEFRVVKRTPKGVWVQYSYGGSYKRFVLMSGRKRFAWPSIEEAAASFRARKRRQVSILRAQLGRAERALEIFNRENTK